MSNSTNSQSTPAEPSNSSPPKPNGPPPNRPRLEEEDRLLAVLALFQERDLWSGLEAVLRAERDAQARESVYCNSEQTRWERGGIVKWIDQVLSGVLAERYTYQARDRLGLSPDPQVGMPDPSGGHPWMEDDGLQESTQEN